MSLGRLWLKNLRYHKRSHLAVFVGACIGTMALTGAWLVGDLLRTQLSRLQQQRLGSASYALTCSRFFTSSLADCISDELGGTNASLLVIPLLQLRGTILVRDKDGRLIRHQGMVQVLGVSPQFWRLFNSDAPDLTGAVAVNETLARQLQLSENSLLEVRLPRPNAIPTDTLAGRNTDESGTAWQVALNLESRPIRYIVPDRQGGAFSLAPQITVPLTVFLPLQELQRRLGEPLNLDNPANVLLVGSASGSHAIEFGHLKRILQRSLKLEDYGLKLRMYHSPAQYASIETNRLLLEDRLADLICQVTQQMGWSSRPTLTYLVNLLWASDWPIDLSSLLAGIPSHPVISQKLMLWRSCYRYVPYVTVTVLDPREDYPWGPFYSWDGQRWERPLNPGEILLTEPSADSLWPEGRWQARLAAHQTLPDVYLRYFIESSGWLLQEKTARLRVAGVLAWRGAVVNPGLTPEFPGLRGTTPAQWKPPFPRSQWHPEWLRWADDQHWRRHRAAPRAFVSAETAQQLGWGSRHGKYTSIRIAPPPDVLLDSKALQQFSKHLLQCLDPEQHGFQWLDLPREAALAATQGPARMFSWLFMGFSIFLVGSALMLIVLLIRLQIVRRASEFGLLTALGYSRSLLATLFGAELSISLLLGCVSGLPSAVLYAWGLLTWIEGRWPTIGLSLSDSAYLSIGQSNFVLSLLSGMTISLLAGLSAIVWSLRELWRFTPRSMLFGRFQAELPGSRNWCSWLPTLVSALSSAVVGLIILILAGHARPTQVPIWFFMSGLAWLFAGLIVVQRILAWAKPSLMRYSWWIALPWRFIMQQPRRNFFAVSLLAITTFTLTAIEVFYKSPSAEALRLESGTGGFRLIAESDIPLPIIPGNFIEWQALMPEETKRQTEEFVRHLEQWGVRIYGFAVKPGDDVSCLNLYQPQRPRILGVPANLALRGGFRFDRVDYSAVGAPSNPWLALFSPALESIPCFADAHTARWVLHVDLGQTISSGGPSPSRTPLRLIGLLTDSIFQGSLLIAEEHFRSHFPEHAGYAFFLIETRADAPLDKVTQTLESALGERYGFSVRRTLDVLGQYHAVENLYLQTFQMLGGFGLILGAGGLALVLRRNIYERQRELALLQALGYTPAMLGCLVLLENAILVLAGLTVGLLAALLSITPHLYLIGAVQQTLVRLISLIAGVLMVGVMSGLAAIYRAVKLPMVPILRQE
ncbi:MAG: ABC transporter permease [Gemmatales bacterium]|nr:ABC transporter permease [Gemmatales bacterium]MDW7993170.1 ABC transporter permease [Gemmatales bacterium]